MSNEWNGQDADRLLNAFSESIIMADDSEYLQERKADGVDTEAVSDNVRSALMAGVKEYFLAQRDQLSTTTATSDLAGSKSFLNKSIEQLQKLLEDTKAKLSHQQALTLCFRGRGAGELTKSEIISQLEKLQFLGLVETTDES